MKTLLIVGAKLLGFLVAISLLLAAGVLPWMSYLEAKANHDDSELTVLTRLPAELWAAVSVLIALAFFSRFIEKTALRNVGLSLRSFFSGNLYGTLLGGTLALVGVLVPFVMGWVSIAQDANVLPPHLLGVLAISLLVNSFVQEAMFRGYALYAIEKSYGEVAGILISSLIFVLVHAGIFAEPADEMILAFLNLFAAGSMLALAYKAAGSLWLPTGIHFGWNYVQAFVSRDVTNSAYVDESHLVHYIGEGRFLSSANFEANAFGLIGPVLGVALMFMYWRKKRSALLTAPQSSTR